MIALKLEKFGDAVGVVLPPELLARLHVAVGDTLHVVETAGGVQLSSADAEHDAQMEVARKVMERNFNVLRELAK